MSMQKKRKSRELQSNSGRRELIVIALGGNALFRRGESGSADEQQRNISNAARHIADLIEMGYRVAIITEMVLRLVRPCSATKQVGRCSKCHLFLCMFALR